MRRVGLLLLLVAILVVATATAASAAPITRTTHSHDVSTFQGDFPCLGEPGRQDDAATITYDTNATLHITAAGEDADGNLIPPYHVVLIFVESFFVVPDNPTLPTYTGRDTATYVENTTQQTFGISATFNGKASGSDGSGFTFNSNFRVQVNANGDMTVDVFNFTCSNER
jgi:hypothetical protein